MLHAWHVPATLMNKFMPSCLRRLHWHRTKQSSFLYNYVRVELLLHHINCISANRGGGGESEAKLVSN